MSDFSRNIGMERLNARYHLWGNVGGVIAPMFAMSVVTFFGGNYRMPLLAAGMIYFSGLLTNTVSTCEMCKKAFTPTSTINPPVIDFVSVPFIVC